MEQHIYSVSDLNNLVKDLLDSEPALSRVYVRGEISNYKLYPSGHHYFSLKDAEGAVRCVLFRGRAAGLRFQPADGMKVIALGQVTLFVRDGAYQLQCASLIPEGVGDLHMAFEQLKEKLYREGLFDEDHKKPLPPFPRTIAVITSSAGDVIHDICTTLRPRWPMAKIMLLPVRVQGPEAPPEIVGALRYVNRHKLADIIITGRGGGSMEDLWAFNDERVARAIYASDIPVISAVGHEPDVTIADFAADQGHDSAMIAVLGLDREKVGDLLVGEGQCDLLILEDIQNFLLLHLDQAGRSRLTLAPIPLTRLEPPKLQVRTMRDTVSSLRLDAVAASGFSLSRGKAADLIASGRFQLNHRECVKPDRTVAQGDVLTCRGLGKCVVKEVGGPSKKGRTMLVLERYV